MLLPNLALVSRYRRTLLLAGAVLALFAAAGLLSLSLHGGLPRYSHAPGPGCAAAGPIC
jgi:hypothetical protein